MKDWQEKVGKVGVRLGWDVMRCDAMNWDGMGCYGMDGWIYEEGVLQLLLLLCLILSLSVSVLSVAYGD